MKRAGSAAALAARTPTAAASLSRQRRRATGRRRVSLRPALKAEPPPDTSRQRILDAALHLLAAHGYEGMSLQMLADTVGLHKATLFHHFPDKQTLAREVLDGVAQRLLEQHQTLATADPPSLDQLIKLVEAQAEYFADHPAVARFLVRIMVAPVDSIFSIDPHDTEHPVVQAVGVLWNWLDRARRAGIIRRVNIPHTHLNIMALTLFYPAAAPDLRGLVGGDPFSSAARRARKRELAAFIRGALSPH